MRRMDSESWALKRPCQVVERRHCRVGEGTTSERKSVARTVVMIAWRAWRMMARRRRRVVVLADLRRWG